MTKTIAERAAGIEDRDMDMGMGTKMAATVKKIWAVVPCLSSMAPRFPAQQYSVVMSI